MARPLRIERPGGRYHVTARGNERKDIFREDDDRFHFLELLGQLGDRFGARVQACVVMDNHYHLLVETSEANLSRAMHWLNAGYCVWFNRRHRRAGHLMQGQRVGRLRLAKLGELAGGLDYAVVNKAIARFGQRLTLDAGLRECVTTLQTQSIGVASCH